MKHINADSTYPGIYAIWPQISTIANTNIRHLSHMHMAEVAEVYHHESADGNMYWLITVIIVKKLTKENIQHACFTDSENILPR